VATHAKADSMPHDSPRGTYRLTARRTGGDVSDVWEATCGTNRYIVKRAQWPEGSSLLAGEFDAIGQLAARAAGSVYRDYLPWPVECFSWGNQHAAVYRLRAGFIDARDIRHHHASGLDVRHVAWMFNRMLEVLGFAHHSGVIHGGVLPTHLLFHPENHGLQLLGWTHCVRLGMPIGVAPARYRSWYPPECVAKEPATPATDIYLAARCALWLAGGDPLTDDFPRHVPAELKGLLVACLSNSPARRPQDAWALRDEWSCRLEDVFGPPKFCHLEMAAGQ